MILGAEKPWMESEAQNSSVNGIKTPGPPEKKFYHIFDSDDKCQSKNTFYQ